MDVLRLLADGRGDREIADALSISSRTVAARVRNILTKPRVPTRAAAATYAVPHGLA